MRRISCAATPENCAVLTLRAILIDQLDIDLVDERRRRRVSHALAPQVPDGDAAQLGVDDRNQLLESRAVAVRPATSSWVTGPGAEAISPPNHS